MHHLQSESPLCADLPRSVCAAQLDSRLLHGRERLRWEGMGMSGLFTTRRPGCTPCSVSSLERGESCAHRKAVLGVSHIHVNGRGCLL